MFSSYALSPGSTNISHSNSNNITGTNIQDCYNSIHHHYYDCSSPNHEHWRDSGLASSSALQKGSLDNFNEAHERQEDEERAIIPTVHERRITFQNNGRPSERSSEPNPTLPDEAGDTASQRISEYSAPNSMETVMSARYARGSTQLKGVHAKIAKFPKDIVSEIQNYMRTEFFYSPYSISLWCPSPSLDLPQHLRERNICIGDVGFINNDGGFDILFNLFLTEQQNRDLLFDPPPGFSPYVPERVPICRKTFMNEEEYASSIGDIAEVPSNSDNSGRDYLCSYQGLQTKGRSQASVLVLPEGVMKEKMRTPTLLKMQWYFDCYAAEWYAHYTGRAIGRTIPKGSLKVVNCCYNSKVWALATFTRNERQPAQDIFIKLYRVKEDSDIYRWVRPNCVNAKTGPSTLEMVDERAIFVNQCVALELTAIKLNKLRNVNTTFRSLVQSMSRISITSSSRHSRVIPN